MEPVVIVAIAGLDEDGRVGQTVSKDLTVDVAKLNTFSNVSSRIFDRRIAVHVRQLAEAKSVCIVVGGVCEAIDVNVVVLGVVDLAHAGVQLVVGNAAPVRWFLVVYRLTNLQQRRRARPASVGVHVHAVRISSAVVTGAVSWRRSVWAVTVRTLHSRWSR